MQRHEADISRYTQALCDHVLVASARDGTLELQRFVSWVLCAGKESRIFPVVLRAAASRASGALRGVLRRNLQDELGDGTRGGSHFDHYLQLLDDIGVSREAFDRMPVGNDLATALSLAIELARDADLPRLYGYLLMNEVATAPVYGALESAALRIFPELSSSFFRLHVDGDAAHVADLLSVASTFSGSRETLVGEGIQLGARGIQLVLDAAQEMGNPGGLDLGRDLFPEAQTVTGLLLPEPASSA